MSTLKVFKHGQEFASLKLEQGQSYFLGRGNDCQVVLDANKSISRQHVRIEFEEGRWVAHLVSKVGRMLKNDEPVILAELTEGASLFIDPYEICFEAEKPESENAIALQNSVSDNNSPVVQSSASESHTPDFDVSEHTAVVSSQLTAHIIIEEPSGRIRNIPLSLPVTEFGRDESCHVQLEESKISRKHFEIRHVSGNTYHITDLGSANGTRLNNLSLEAHQAHPINSKDYISVSNTTVTFELRDPKFDNIVNQLVPAAPTFDPMAQQHHAMIPYDYSAYANAQGPAVVKVGANDFKSKFSALPKKVKMRIGLGLALVVLVIFGLIDSPNPSSEQQSSQSSTAGDGTISEEQQAIVKDTFVLARNHFMQGKYELCSTEIIKLHGIVPFYENSKELEVLCLQAKELQDIEREKERLQKQKEEIEMQVAEVVSECREKLTTFKTEEEINNCLAQAIELNPENPAIEEMRNYLKIKEEEKLAKAEQEEAYRKRIAAGEAKYYAAKNLKSKNQLKKAIGAYEDYLESSYPDPKNLKTVAQRELASVRSELSQKISGKLDSCKNLLQQNQYKSAALACDDVLKEDSSHAEAIDTKRQAVANLRREMRGIYEDAILEESLGNIDSAKDKWRKIVSEDLRDGEHATKAKIKLRKYGVEL